MVNSVPKLVHRDQAHEETPSYVAYCPAVKESPIISMFLGKLGGLNSVPVGERWIDWSWSPKSQFVTLNSKVRAVVMLVLRLNCSVPCRWKG